jgi:gas vesicle protein
VGQDPEEIRREIEATRDRMEDTVEAIGYKTDVRARTQDRISGTRERIMSKVRDAKDRAMGSIVGTKETASARLEDAASRVGEATPDRGDLGDKARRTAGMAQENPLGLAVGSVAVGFLAGLVLPATKVEKERVGPVAQDVREKVKETGKEAVERAGKVIEEIPRAAEEAKQAAAEKVVGSAQEQASGLASSAKERAQDISPNS